MKRSFFDYDSNDICYQTDHDHAYNSDGDYLMRVSDNTALDLDTGELHITSSWNSCRDSDRDDDDDTRSRRSLWDDEDE